MLVQITTDSGGAGAVTLNGVDVTSAFHAGTAPNTLLGLVTGLNLGRNTLATGGRTLVDLVEGLKPQDPETRTRIVRLKPTDEKLYGHWFRRSDSPA